MKSKMKTSIVLSSIAIIVLLVTTISITYTYFLNSQDDYANGVITLMTNTGGTSSVFDASGNMIAMNITNELMSQATANNQAVEQTQLI